MCLDRVSDLESRVLKTERRLWRLGMFFGCIFLLSLVGANAPAERGLVDRVADLERLKPPIGSVIAYIGDWDKKDEAKLGWALADGRVIDSELKKHLVSDLVSLVAVLPEGRKVALPDLQGRHLRGHTPERKLLEERDIDRSKYWKVIEDKSKDQKTRDEAKTRVGVGSFQEAAAYIASATYKVGRGQFFKSNMKVAGDGIYVMSDIRSESVGEQSPFTISGKIHEGDDDDYPQETHPANVAVNWIIRVR